MHIVQMIVWILLIVGGLNWGLVGLANFNLIEAILGAGSVLTTILYLLVGVSAILSIICRVKSCCCKNSCSK